MRPYVFKWVLMGPYMSFCVLKVFNCVLISPNKSLGVIMDYNGSFWVPISGYESLRILMGPYGSL